MLSAKNDDNSKKNNDNYDDNVKNLNCSDITSNYKQLHMKVYGIKLYIYSNTLKKNLIIYGIIDDVIIEFLNNEYILTKQKNLHATSLSYLLVAITTNPTSSSSFCNTTSMQKL